MKHMDIEFTKEQYENLLKLVYLGDWLVNSFRTERVSEFEDLENHLYSFAKDSGLGRLVVFDEDTKTHLPADSLEETVTHYIEAYDEDKFWDELCHSLGQRDFIRHYGQAAIRKMKLEEMFQKEAGFINKYAEEFEKHGLKNLEIVP